MNAVNYTGPWISHGEPDYWEQVPPYKQAEMVTAWIAAAKENGDPVTKLAAGENIEQTHQHIIEHAVEAVSRHLWLVTSGITTLAFEGGKAGPNGSLEIHLKANLDAFDDEALDNLLIHTYRNMTDTRPIGVKAACELVCK
jgi:hypothetical protein